MQKNVKSNSLPLSPRGSSWLFFLSYLMILATLAKYNRQRGVITWRYCEGADGSYFSIRNDGRKYPYPSKEEMRTGYAYMKNTMGFAPVDLLAV